MAIDALRRLTVSPPSGRHRLLLSENRVAVVNYEQPRSRLEATKTQCLERGGNYSGRTVSRRFGV